jgi:hypothetical protein
MPFIDDCDINETKFRHARWPYGTLKSPYHYAKYLLLPFGFYVLNTSFRTKFSSSIT